MKVYIHIGWPKTGTSALQAHINANRKWLQLQGIAVPTSGYASGFGHAFLYSRHHTKTASPNLAIFLGEEGEIETLRGELLDYKARGFRAALLSWEAFSMADSTLIALLGGALKGFDIEVLAYIRDQPALYQSLQIQAIETYSAPLSFLDSNSDEILRNLPWFIDFHSVLSRWRDALPAGATVSTRVYDIHHLIGGDIVHDFYQWIGAPTNEPFCFQFGDINHSLDLTSAMILALMDSAGINQRTRTRLVHALSQATSSTQNGPSSFLDHASIREIKRYYRDSNIALFQDFPPNNVDIADCEAWISEESPPSSDEFPNQVVELCKAAYSSLNSKFPEIWHGDILLGHNLYRVTSRLHRGWRSTEEAGVWSIGGASEITFRLPHLGPSDGPTHVVLMLRGRYFRDNQSTVVELDTETFRIDLRNAEIPIAIGDKVLNEGVVVRLFHDAPCSPAEADIGPSTDLLAFMLASLSYRLEWRS